MSAMGDVTLVVPAVKTIQKAFPRARISWIISPLAHELLAGLPGVDFIVMDKPASLGDYLALRRRLQPYRFDVLLAMQASLRINLIYPFIHARRRIGFDRRRARDGQWLFTAEQIPFQNGHLLSSFLDFAHLLGAREDDIRWDLPVPEADRQWAATQLQDLPGPYLAINPAASKAERNWPARRYVELIESIRRRWHPTIVLTGGPGELDMRLAEAICRACPEGVLNLVGRTRPKQLAALLQAVDVLVAPDTGPAHVATAMGTPVVGMFAVAPPGLSRPWLWPQLVVDRFPEAVEKLLGKDPATVPWGTRVHDVRAMQLITVDDVLDKLSQVLGC